MDRYIKLTTEQKQLFGIGAAKITTIGSFDKKVQIDQSIVDLTFHVVATNDISYGVILGNLILKHFDMLGCENGIEFKEKLSVPINDTLRVKDNLTNDDDLMTNIFSN